MIAGAVLAIIGAVLPWLLVGHGSDLNGFQVPLSFVLGGDASTVANNGFPVGVVILLAAVVAVVAGFVSKTGRLRRSMGGIITLLSVVYSIHLASILNQLGSSDAFFKVLGPGVYAAVIGAIVLAL